MKVQVFTGVRTRVRNSIPAHPSPRIAGDIRAQRAQLSRFAPTTWASSTRPANVQNVTAGTGGPAPSAGTKSPSNMAPAVSKVGERKITIASVKAVKVSAI